MVKFTGVVADVKDQLCPALVLWKGRSRPVSTEKQEHFRHANRAAGRDKPDI